MAHKTLPIVEKVREVHSFIDYGAVDHVGSFVLIAPDPMAGRKHVYSVIRVDYQSGQAVCIGRELDLPLARKVAKRPVEEDGRPILRGKMFRHRLIGGGSA